MLGAGFDAMAALHESWSHLLERKWWSETTVREDSATSEAPLYNLDVDVLPPPVEFLNGETAAGARVGPVAAENERLEGGSRVELAGLVHDRGLNGQRNICMRRAPDEERWLIAMPGGRRVNVKMSNIKPAGDPDAEVVQREPTRAYPLKGLDAPLRRAMIEAHNLTHLPAAP